MTRIDDLPMRGDAIFSANRKYRYVLTRNFDDISGDACVFIMLNPSTATETEGDPSVRRCISYARAWGYGGLVVLNLFALRSTNPNELYKSNDPVGPENIEMIRQVMGGQSWSIPQPFVVCAWGNHGAYLNQGNYVMDILRDLRVMPRVLGYTGSGQPKHPLYLPRDLIPFLAEGTTAGNAR